MLIIDSQPAESIIAFGKILWGSPSVQIRMNAKNLLMETYDGVKTKSSPTSRIFDERSVYPGSERICRMLI